MRVHLLGIELVGVLALLLRAVHCDIRVLQQGLQVVAVDRTGAHADARRDLKFPAVYRHRLRHLDEDLFGHLSEVVRAFEPLDQHDEFVAALPRNRIRPAHAARQPIRHILQEPVPRLMAQGVIDVLEAIKIDEQHGDASSFALCRSEGAIDSFGQQQPIRQARQRVVSRREFDYLFRVLPVLDFPPHEQDHDAEQAEI